MRKGILLLVALLLFFLLSSCELFSQEPPVGTLYFINVGLDYENNLDPKISKLTGPINDAKEISYALQNLASSTSRPSQGYLMIQEGSDSNILDPLYPTKENIEAKLAALAAITHEEDLTILTYSGHGEKETGKLLLAINSSNVAELLSSEELLSWMAQIKGKKLLILDSCFSGMFVPENPSSTNTILNSSIKRFFDTYYSSSQYKKPDLFVLTASTHTDSYEKKFNTHYHGIFTYALLEGLGWKHHNNTPALQGSFIPPPAARSGIITIDTLFQYVLKNQDIASRLSFFPPALQYQHSMTTGGPLSLVLFKGL